MLALGVFVFLSSAYPSAYDRRMCPANWDSSIEMICVLCTVVGVVVTSTDTVCLDVHINRSLEPVTLLSTRMRTQVPVVLIIQTRFDAASLCQGASNGGPNTSVRHHRSNGSLP
jgi:hypothetical protein